MVIRLFLVMTKFWDYIADWPTYKKTFLFVVGLFFACVGVGIIACLIFSGLAAHFIHQAQTTPSLAVVTKAATQAGPVGEFIGLFLNNLVVCLLAIFMPYAIQRKWARFLIYGPLMSLGLLTGAVILVVTAQHNLLFTFSSLVPHGLFEMTAYFMSATYGLVIFNTKETPGAEPLGQAWKYGIGNILCYIIPLVLIASFVEAFITPILMTLVL